MQTFLPYANFEASAKVLDYKRLGKQRVEAKQILEINTRFIYLRGSNIDKDFKASSISFKTKEEMLEYKHKLLKSLEMWAKNWKGFKEASTETLEQDSSIYTF